MTGGRGFPIFQIVVGCIWAYGLDDIQHTPWLLFFHSLVIGISDLYVYKCNMITIFV
jgi:hypothetical protein